MRKRLLGSVPSSPSSESADWLEVEQVAEVELTSDDPAYPVEGALRPGNGPGWRAAGAGTQVIRLHFDVPQHLRRIRLVFEERDVARTQEFALRWSSDGGQSYRELVRQQYNFSPPGTVREIEEYDMDLREVSSLELRIVPDVSGGECRASLEEWRLA